MVTESSGTFHFGGRGMSYRDGEAEMRAWGPLADDLTANSGNVSVQSA